jgi:hypothetical protein
MIRRCLTLGMNALGETAQFPIVFVSGPDLRHHVI